MTIPAPAKKGMHVIFCRDSACVIPIYEDSVKKRISYKNEFPNYV